MNRETYNELRNTISNFDQLYTQMVNIEDIVFDDMNSQVRMLGHAHAKVPAMIEARNNGAVVPPISLRKLANGKSEVKDGATRFLTEQARGQKQILGSYYHDQVVKPDGDQWFDIQCMQNDHPVQTSNSEADIENQIAHRVNNGVLEKKVGFKYHSDPDRFLDDSVTYLKTIYKNSGHGTKVLKNMVKRCLKGTISSFFQSYSKDTAMDLINNSNQYGWTTDKKRTSDAIGDICNNVCFYACATYAQFKTNAFANGAYKKIDNPNTDIYIVFYVSELAGKTEKKIKEQRAHVAKEYDKINNNYLDSNGNKIFSGLYFLPQIKTGANKEDLHKLIKAR